LIVTEPGATPVATPEVFTLATAELLDDHFTDFVMFCVLPSE